MNGFFLVDKPRGITSFGVIKALQNAFSLRLGIRFKSLPSFGHGGTLDPFATGLLVVAVGPATKLTSFLLGGEKTYEAVLQLGVQTLSGDFETGIVKTSDVRPDSLSTIQSAADFFSAKPYEQTPPMYSAKKLDGKPLYELARKGISVKRKPQTCHLSDFEVVSYEGDLVRFKVRVSSGTYIRTLGEDLAIKLGTVGTLLELRRLEASRYTVAQARSLEFWTSQFDFKTSPAPFFIPFDQALDFTPAIEVSEREAKDLLHGKKEVLREIALRAPAQRAGLFRIIIQQQLIAIVKMTDIDCQPTLELVRNFSRAEPLGP